MSNTLVSFTDVLRPILVYLLYCDSGARALLEESTVPYS